MNDDAASTRQDRTGLTPSGPPPTRPKFPRGPVVPSHSPSHHLLLFSLLAANFVGGQPPIVPAGLDEVGSALQRKKIATWCARSAFLHLDCQAKLIGFAQPYCPKGQWPVLHGLSARRQGRRAGGGHSGEGRRDRPTPPLSPLSGVGDMSTTNLFGPEGTRASNCGRQNAAGMSPSQTLDAGRGRMRPSDGHPAAVLCMHGSNHVRSPSSTRVWGPFCPNGMPSALAVGPRLPGLVGALLCRF